MTARLLPFLIFWRAALLFAARPTAILLDWWLGVEGIAYLHERDVRSLVARAAASGGDIGKLEATGVRTFSTSTIWRLPRRAGPCTTKHY